MKKNIKVIAIISSSNFNGNSATLAREALKGAKEAGAEVSEIYLPKCNIEFCTGCLKCLENKCPFQDDFESIRSKLYESDGIILSSPTYAMAPNAIMKNFIDRLAMYENFTSSLAGKYIAGISTGGNRGPQKVAKGLASLPTNSVFRRGYTSGTLGVVLGGSKARDNKNAMIAAHNLGTKIVQDIQIEKHYPLQNLLNRLILRSVVKPKFTELISKNKNGSMKAVYNSLSSRGLI